MVGLKKSWWNDSAKQPVPTAAITGMTKARLPSCAATQRGAAVSTAATTRMPVSQNVRAFTHSAKPSEDSRKPGVCPMSVHHKRMSDSPAADAAPHAFTIPRRCSMPQRSPFASPLRFCTQYSASAGARVGRRRKMPAPSTGGCCISSGYRTAKARLADSGDTTSSAVRARTVIS